MFVSIYAATCPLVCRPHCNRTAVVMSTYKRAFRLALHAWRILYLQIIFALLERSAAVDSGFHAALFVPTLCICKEFIMLHEKWYLWCSFLYFFARARCNGCVAMYLGESDRTAWLQLHVSRKDPAGCQAGYPSTCVCAAW